MKIGDLYNLVLVLGLVAVVTGIVLIILANLSAQTSGAAGTAINNAITAISAITNTWLGLIVTVSILILLLALVIRGIANQGGR